MIQMRNYSVDEQIIFADLFMLIYFRAGPILQLNWEEFESICETNMGLTTNKHKTGKFYTVHLYVNEDQRPLLRKMRQTYIDEFNATPRYIFSSPKNKVESSICANLQETFQKVFGDNPAEVRFNANSIRKYWERRWLVIQKQVSDGVSKAHYAQTAHSKKTAEENYLEKNGTPEDRNILFATYGKDLERSDIEQEEPETAPPNESVESDFEDDMPTVKPQHIQKPKVPPKPTLRFNPLRDSLQNDPSRSPLVASPLVASSSCAQLPVAQLPVAQLPSISAVAGRNKERESLNSTLETIDTPKKKYFASLKSFRVKPNRPPWTEEEKKACMFFEDYPYVNRVEVEKRIQECGITLTAAAYDRIWAKIKTARQVLKK